MKHSLALMLSTAALLVACGKDNKTASDADRCTRALAHVSALMRDASTSKDAKPSAEEQTAIDAIEKASLEQCKGEGLSQAQFDCIVGAKDLASFNALRSCPAIKDKQPSWLILPPGP